MPKRLNNLSVQSPANVTVTLFHLDKLNEGIGFEEARVPVQNQGPAGAC